MHSEKFSNCCLISTPLRRRTLLDEINQSESSPGVQTKKKGDNRQVDGKIAYSSVSDVVVVELKLNANGKEVHCSARELKPSVSILSNLQLEFSTGHINVWPRVSLTRLHLFALWTLSAVWMANNFPSSRCCRSSLRSWNGSIQALIDKREWAREREKRKNP